MPQEMTIWTIQLAVLCQFSVLVGTQFQHQTQLSKGGLDWEWLAEARWLKWIWLCGGGLALCHMVCAFHFVHHWSHGLAIQATADQTEQLLGIRLGGGVYFNYLFVITWLLDSAWWSVFPLSYAQRPTWIQYAIGGYLLFITLNGTMVFAAGLSRWGTLLLLLIWIGLAINNRSLQKKERPLLRTT